MYALNIQLAVVYYLCQYMSLHVLPGERFVFSLDSRLAKCLVKKLSFWLSACSVLIVVPLLLVRHSFPLVSLTEGVR